jgi:hypothetical protein
VGRRGRRRRRRRPGLSPPGHRQERVAQARAVELERQQRDPGVGERAGGRVDADPRRHLDPGVFVQRHGHPVRAPVRGSGVGHPAGALQDADRAGAKLGGDPETPAARRRRPAGDLRHGAVGDDAPAVQDHDPRADLLHLRQHVGAQDDRDAAFAGDALDHAQHLRLTGRVEAECRLVEEHDRGVADQRAGDAQALAHAAAEVPDRRRRTRGQPNLGEQRVGGGRSGGARVPVEAGEVSEELARRLCLGIARALGEHADPAADLGGARVRHARHRE